MDAAHRVLKETFGFSSFRLSQEAVIKRLLVDNENALVLYPTGGGKSLTFQVPALCLEGITLVISPLIALMKDQVDVLVEKGVKAANLDSTLGADRLAWVKQEVLSGSMKILYVAPERLNNEGFIAMMQRVKISLLAVDESHCIAQWGASFRPEYLKIARFAEEMNVERVLCLTATATPEVAMEICKSFYIHPTEGVFRTPVFRPNLSLRVEVADTLDDKLNKIIPMLKARTGPVIVYVTLQKQAQEVANYLLPHGLEALVYHAGMTNDERTKVQNDFMRSDKGIVCATIAFGMGIDKANIHQVIHLHMAKTLENYSQEVGRAGRDGLESTCVMFLSSIDLPVLEGFARGDTCARRDLELWIQEVALAQPSSDGAISFNHYVQQKTYDIRQNVLNLLYAQLELDHKYIRAVTPFYSNYDISENGSAAGWQKVMNDTSPAAKAIRAHWIRKGATYQVDVVNISEHAKIDRVELAKKINGWELDGHINSKASQVRQRYIIINPLPRVTAEIKILADKLYQGMLERESDAIKKMKRVIEFATDDDCLAHALASYFGDTDAIAGGMCGKCSFCQTGAGANFSPACLPVPDPRQIQAILAACPERDDPRLLARMAFGIASPRLTTGKWSTSHPLFASMVSFDFDALVAAFDVECKKAGYENLAQPVKTAVKRTYSQTTSYSYPSRSGGGSSRGRGSGSKRARGRFC